MCAAEAEECPPPQWNGKTEAQTRVGVIFCRGGGLPPAQAEKTVVGGLIRVGPGWLEKSWVA